MRDKSLRVLVVTDHPDDVQLLEEAFLELEEIHYTRDWLQPVRHPLGAALLQAGRLGEAEAVFRTDLLKLPGNGWSLFGLARSLRLQKRNAEAAVIEKQFARTWAKADMKIKSACLCLPGV